MIPASFNPSAPPRAMLREEPSLCARIAERVCSVAIPLIIAVGVVGVIALALSSHIVLIAGICVTGFFLANHCGVFERVHFIHHPPLLPRIPIINCVPIPEVRTYNCTPPPYRPGPVPREGHYAGCGNPRATQRNESLYATFGSN